MLNKQICKKCHKQNDIDWHTADDMRWDENGIIVCPLPHIKLESDTMQTVTAITIIPKWCKYQLEHTVSINKK